MLSEKNYDELKSMINSIEENNDLKTIEIVISLVKEAEEKAVAVYVMKRANSKSLLSLSEFKDLYNQCISGEISLSRFFEIMEYKILMKKEG